MFSSMTRMRFSFCLMLCYFFQWFVPYVFVICVHLAHVFFGLCPAMLRSRLADLRFRSAPGLRRFTFRLRHRLTNGASGSWV